MSSSLAERTDEFDVVLDLASSTLSDGSTVEAMRLARGLMAMETYMDKMANRIEALEARVKELSAERDDVARRLIVLETGDYTALTERLRLAEEVCESTDRYMTNPDWPHPREGMDVMADLATWRKVKIEP